MDYRVVTARMEDVSVLVDLIRKSRDKSAAQMSNAELEKETMLWIFRDWKVVLLYHHKQAVGFCAFKEDTDDQEMSRMRVFIHRFYVVPGYSMEWFYNHLCEVYFTKNSKIALDIEDDDLQERGFWEQMGFYPSFTRLAKVS